MGNENVVLPSIFDLAEGAERKAPGFTVGAFDELEEHIGDRRHAGRACDIHVDAAPELAGHITGFDNPGSLGPLVGKRRQRKTATAASPSDDSAQTGPDFGKRDRVSMMPDRRQFAGPLGLGGEAAEKRCALSR